MRIYTLCLLSTLALSWRAYAQNEHVYLQFSKNACHPGDTLWFKGYILKGVFLSKVSTNLYIELYTPRGGLMEQYDFPVSGGVSLGQISIPDSIPTDNYYVKAFTRYMLNYDSTTFFSAPIFVYNKNKPAPVLHKQAIVHGGTLTSGAVAGITWTTTLIRGKLTSMLEMDSATKPRKFKLVEPLRGDSTYVADFTFDSVNTQRFTFLPVDTNKETVILLLYEGIKRIGYQLLHIRDNSDTVTLTPDTLSTSPQGYNSWEIRFPGSNTYSASISVNDADRTDPPSAAIWQLNESRTDDLTVPVTQVDDSYITFQGIATSRAGKPLKKADIVFSGASDTSLLFTQVVPVDARGNFKLDSLFFFGNMDLQYQLNKANEGNSNHINLIIEKFVPPVSDSALLTQDWMDDSTSSRKVDTVLANMADTEFDSAKAKNLATVVINGWKSPREELDHKYTSGVFSEPTAFSFDLRSETGFNSLEDFLRANISGIQFDLATGRPKYNDTTVLFYLDESPATWDFLKSGSLFKSLAYAKAFVNQQWLGETPFSRWSVKADEDLYKPHSMADTKPPQPEKPAGLQNSNPLDPLVVCLYTRKGPDFRMMAGGMNRTTVKGYSDICKFTPDLSTLFWDPAVFGNKYRVRFHNNNTARRFRIVIEGIDYKGKLIHIEKVLE